MGVIIVLYNQLHTIRDIVIQLVIVVVNGGTMIVEIVIIITAGLIMD